MSISPLIGTDLLTSKCSHSLTVTPCGAARALISSPNYSPSPNHTMTDHDLSSRVLVIESDVLVPFPIIPTVPASSI